ncbi:putative polyketide synthase [Aspergillus nomiae NRRL 13137]|uniref:Putative polyketide synthase n=1 Tax=Aspergillus nomiae NRRL (strain ATCC 15546 / NRRL 13137 / CBS 260.88 / M93) TaxID=1509407 RepID=A0A0L1IUW1_ASPN3|nr:putative polyketide synthase [Aspergillus nomiae NRRL 13137]KNG83279.1 putative polyketide synthase [Aspergillus nomiae NRRL 13137]
MDIPPECLPTTGETELTGAPHVQRCFCTKCASYTPEIDPKDAKASRPPIAIVGMGMRLPGGATAKLCDPKNPRQIRTRHGYYLQEDPAYFDAEFFSMGSVEASRADLQQRLLLEVVWECLENAGETDWRGKNIGCYVGTFGEDWLSLSTKEYQHIDRYYALGTGGFALSNRISYVYDFKGPSMTIQTGCSASLVGLHEACQALYLGECSSAVVAGTNLILTPNMTKTMSANMVISESGMCRSFDQCADGYGRGEAINAIYIKRLDDAIHNNDPIRGVIRGSALNSDRWKSTLTAPDLLSQENLIRTAYSNANISDISKTPYFECHGTGTAVGDSVESSAIALVTKGSSLDTYMTRCLADTNRPKPNVGHSEGASGITGVIKAVLSLESGVIPPVALFETPRQGGPLTEGQLTVPTDAKPWPADRLWRASVNGFGIGGSNAHIIVDRGNGITGSTNSNLNVDSQLIVTSASSVSSLKKRIRQITQYINHCPSSLSDMSYTLGSRRHHLDVRAFAVVHPSTPLEDTAFQFTEAASHTELIFTFTGQGAQWPGMGAALLEHFESFKDDVEEMELALKGLDDPPQWSLKDELNKSINRSRVMEPEFSQPLCIAIQIGLVNIFAQWGIKPTAVLGHSSGEMAAAYAAQAISATDAIVIAYYRGKFAKSKEGLGGMVAINTSRDMVHPFLREGVVIGCENSPRSVTLSGDKDQIDQTVEDIEQSMPGICRHLRVNVAYHSHHMKDIGPAYETAILKHTGRGEQMLPMHSSVTGKSILCPQELDAGYWRRNLESSVLFSDAVHCCLESNSSKRLAFVEIGPHSALAAPLQQIFKVSGGQGRCAYISTITRFDNDFRTQLLASVGHIHINGGSVNLPSIVSPGKTLTDLPPYPWQHGQRFWEESRTARDWRLQLAPHHQLLGSRVTDTTDTAPSWKNMLSVEDVPWLSDHVVQEEIIYPGAAYIAMAGSAVLQLHPEFVSYTIRDLLIIEPLLVNERGPTEIITSFQPVEIADNVYSDFYNFSIVSYQGSSWVKHCGGRVRPGYEIPPRKRPVGPYDLSCTPNEWYEATEACGITYGKSFRGLENITVDPKGGGRASAVVHNSSDLDYHTYSMHPASIDQAFQAIMVGILFNALDGTEYSFVPVSVDRIYITQGGPLMTVGTSVKSHTQSSYYGNPIGLVDDHVVLEIEGAVFGALDNGNRLTSANTNLLTRTEWRPDFDLLPKDSTLTLQPFPANVELIAQALGHLSLLAHVETAKRLEAAVTEVVHLNKWKAQINEEVSSLHQRQRGLFTMLEGNGVHTKHVLNMTSEQRQVTKDHWIGVLKDSGSTSMLTVFDCMDTVLEKSLELMCGEVSPLEFLMNDNLFEKMYEQSIGWVDCSAFFVHLSHSNPNLRILEIGAGTGSCTKVVLRHLKTQAGIRRYKSYTFTDISPTFTQAAMEKFREQENFEYRILDISEEPIKQGFEPDSYDLIIASNVLHATPSIRKTLQNVRTLLSARGQLFLVELDPAVPNIDMVIGILPGWWVGESDGRPLRPYISVERWDSELKATGFSGVDVAHHDRPGLLRTNAIMISTALKEESYFPADDVTLLLAHEPGHWEKDVQRQLTQRGHLTEWAKISDPVPQKPMILSFLDMNSSFLHDMSEGMFIKLKEFLKGCSAITSSQCIWITPATRLQCTDPSYGLIWGFARTLQREMELDLSIVEVDRFDEGEDEVEVELLFIGLNFKDLMVAQGLLGSEEELGLEGSGVVRRVGSNVVDLKVDDKVLAIGFGLFRTLATIPAEQCLRIPDGISLEKASTMPAAYVSVIYSLLHRAVLDRGDSILIHSACGGVGIAAIHLSQSIGAKIYATVSTEEKAQYLLETFGIPRNNIFDSRSSSFYADLMRETNGRGVDVVLNSLAGKLLHVSWDCVAEFGQMVELGKRDILTHGTLSMSPFSENRSFIAIDLMGVLRRKRALATRLGHQFIELYKEGKIGPILPVRTFHAQEVQEAFRYLQGGLHKGKIIIRMPESPSELHAMSTQCSITFPSDTSYLLVGGLGDVGRVLARWMVRRGARELVIMSRSTRRVEREQSFIKELEAQNCQIITVAGDVTNLEDVKAAVSSCTKPLAGVLSPYRFLFQDRTLLHMTHAEWKSALAPKVSGTWNLHRAVEGQRLDFFLVLSSLVGITGHAGQANYSAACTYLDAFTQYRRQMGLPSSVVDLGPVAGSAAIEDQAVSRQLDTAGWTRLSKQQLIASVQLAISESRAPNTAAHLYSSELIIGFFRSLSETEYTKMLEDDLYGRDARLSMYQNLVARADNRKPDNQIKLLFERVEKDPRLFSDPGTHTILVLELAKLINHRTSQLSEMDLGQAQAVAVDSLMAIEVKSWLSRQLGLHVTVDEITKANTVGSLVQIIVQRAKAKYRTSEDGTASTKES